MIFLPSSEIFVPPTRQRRAFDQSALAALGVSISKLGLLHPIVVREEKGMFVLVAGERRLRAIADLYDLGDCFVCDGHPVPPPNVPCILFADLDPLAAEEAELEENVVRVDLSWQEKSAATKKLLDLRQLQAQRRGEAAPTHVDIAEEIKGKRTGWDSDYTRKQIILADHLSDPDVIAAKSVDEAFKVLKKKEEAKKNLALAERVGATFSSASHAALNTDSLAFLRECPAESFDVILTDPPYGMGADEFGDSGGLAEGAHDYTDDIANFTRLFTVCQEQFIRITKPQAHLYWFCDIDMFAFARSGLEAAGWWVHRTPLIWHKPGAMRVPWPDHGPQRKWEMCLYAVKGKKPANRIAPDLITANPDSNLGHGAQKPVALFHELLSRSVKPGDSVLDPFAGTGPIFPAAHALKCRATGIELSSTHYGIMLKRLEALKEPQLNLEGV